MSIDVRTAAPEYPGSENNFDASVADFAYGDYLQLNWSPGEADAYAPPPDLTVSECADLHRVLQAGISRNPGPWRTDYTPYLQPVMDAYNIDSARHIVFCAGTQLGKTESLYNILEYIIAFDPYPTLHMSPREDDAKLVSRTRIQPMIEDCEILRERKPDKSTLFQTLEMHFPGMVLYLVGANSLAGLASKPCRNILRDEIDKYPERLGEDADPLSKAEERAKSFWDIRKVIDVSSPTYEYRGILKQLTNCDVINAIHHPCPHCRQLIRLYMPQIIYDDQRDDRHRVQKAKRSAVYVCQRCGAHITNDQRPWMIANFQYIPQRTITFGIENEDKNEPIGELDFEPESIGFWISSLSSPMLNWGDVAEAWIKATMWRDETGDTAKLQNFINDWLAEPWLVSTKKSTTDQVLARKCERPPLVVPEWAVALTCGIDVQKWGFWFTVWAFDKSMRSALIHYGFLESWDDVRRLCLETSFPVENSKQRMQIWRAGIDIGGGEESQWGDDFTKTEEIVTWVRENGQGVVHAVKGMSVNKTGQKIKHSIMDRMPGQKGGKIPGGLVLWLIDTFMMKENIFWRFECEPSDPQPVELHAETGEDFGLQLTAEEKRQGKNGRWAYVQVRKDNHLLDATVYAHAASDFQWMGGVNILAEAQYIKTVQVYKQMQGNSQFEQQPSPVHHYNMSERLKRRR